MWIIFASLVTATVLILPTDGVGCCFWQKGKKEDKEAQTPAATTALSGADDGSQGVAGSQSIDHSQRIDRSQSIGHSQRIGSSQRIDHGKGVDLTGNSGDTSELHVADGVHIPWLVRLGWKEGREEGHHCTGVLANIGSEFKGKIVVTTAGCVNSLGRSVNNVTAMLEQSDSPVSITNMFGCKEATTEEGRHKFDVGLVFLADTFGHRVSLPDHTTQVPPGADLRTADWVHHDIFTRQGKTPPGAPAQAPEEFIIAEKPIAVGVREGDDLWNHPEIDVTDNNDQTSTIKFGTSSGAPAIMGNGGHEVVVALFSRVGAGSVRTYANLKYYGGILETMVAQGEKLTRTGKAKEAVKGGTKAQSLVCSQQ